MHVVQTESGALAGADEGSLSVFRRVPYAAPPTGRLRFMPPVPVMPWDGVRAATSNGPVCVQGRSRLADVMGDFQAEQGEDCLSLTIWTPAADAARRPVLVWLHGGAYSSGAGSLPWYSGHRLAENGDVVVVSVNYRLGALGYLYLPPVSEGNLGLLDQLAALRWVRRNIANFGGDPAAVTLAGQSAGAMSALILMDTPAAQGLFRRAILQSPAMSRLTQPAADAEAIGAEFARRLGVDRALANGLRAAPVEQLLRAQGELARERARFADVTPLFMPVIDGTTIAHDVFESLCADPAPGIDVLMGTTREESAAFCAIDPRIAAATPAQVDAVFERDFGADAAIQADAYRRRRPGADALTLLGDVLTDKTFLIGLLQFAQSRARAGRPAYVYQFDWQSPAPERFASCHCLELPFIFGNSADWQDAPMLAGADRREIDALSTVMQRTWLAFVRSGSPDNELLPAWEPYEPRRRTTMRFDRLVGPIDDLAGIEHRPPWPGVQLPGKA